jgi:hypothetical protein
VAHPYPESFKIVAWAIPSGWLSEVIAKYPWLKSVLPGREGFTEPLRGGHRPDGIK